MNTKRLLALLLAAALCIGGMSGCKAPTSIEKLNNEAINVTPVDAFGNHSISLLGDSISHGACASDIPNTSWVGLLRKAINQKTGDDNYGFTTVEGTLWSSVGTLNELHPFPTCNYGTFTPRGQGGSGWVEYRTAELLGTKGLASVAKGDWLQFEPSVSYAYFCVYYESGSKYGGFTVGGSDGGVIADLDGNTEVDCGQGDGFARTAFYDASQLPEDGAIRITTTTKKQVMITGIGYYNTLDGVVLNNYANGGLQFAGSGKSTNGDVTGLDNKIVDFAATSGTLIFALGYNDAHFFEDYDLFAEKIDHLIEVANENGTKMVVVDLCWDFDTGDERYHSRYPYLETIKEGIKRLADETNGVFVSPQDIYGQTLLDTIEDGAHPDDAGHRMIADAVIAALGLPEIEA